MMKTITIFITSIVIYSYNFADGIASQNLDCVDKYKTVVDHTACRDKSSTAKTTGISEEDKIVIVDRHNSYRADVRPTASNMLKLRWDNELATIAQHWANACEFQHDSYERRSIPGRLTVGQNIASNGQTWDQIIDLWQSEVASFTYGGKTNIPDNVGHYTQLVWADTQLIGCGYAMCDAKSFYVCNYGPAGNIGGYSTPYKQGTECADCSTKCDTGGKLCDCPNTCKNSGTLDRNTCSCRCKWEFYLKSSNCALDCTKVKTDPSFCSSSYTKNSCAVIDSDCPNYCVICPYGGLNYIEGSVAIRQRSTAGRPDINIVTAVVTFIYISARHI